MSRKITGICLHPELIDQVDRLTDAIGMSRSEFIARILEMTMPKLNQKKVDSFGSFINALI